MSRSALLGATFLPPALILASISGTFADGALATGQATSSFSMKPNADDRGPYEVTTINTRFETDFVPPSTGADAAARGDIYQLVEIEETHVNKDGPTSAGDQVAGKVKATVYPLEPGGPGAAKFTIEAEGDQATVDGPYLTVTRWGCCASEATNAVYSLETGRYLFNATGMGESGQWATLTSHDFQRILAYHAAPTEMDDVVLKGADNACVVMTYARQPTPTQRVLVTVPTEIGRASCRERV